MPISGDRALGLERWKQRSVKGFHRTVTLESVYVAPGNSDYRSGEATIAWSKPIDPRPIVRLVSDEDVTEGGPAGVSLGDYILEVFGDAFTEDEMLQATQVVFDKGLNKEEFLRIVKFRPGGWREFQIDQGNELAIIGGKVIMWKIWVRATKRAV